MRRNITLSIDEELLKEAKVLAASTDRSVTGLLTDLLENHIRESLAYEQAMARALSRLKRGYELNFTPGSRDDLHER